MDTAAGTAGAAVDGLVATPIFAFLGTIIVKWTVEEPKVVVHRMQ